SATGETGPGLVPRDPKVLSRFVAALNGGFQAQHGAFGMMSERVVYLPPKPFAATVAELSDENTGFGTWPVDTTIPDEMLSFRQNMTPLIVDGVFNPYHRYWWGGVPPGWTDESRTVRSGICLTQEKFVAYFYAESVDANHLAVAMKRARCTYGIHLDMNPGHVGLEFYRVSKTEDLPSLDRPLEEEWQARGPVPDANGWEFMGRRMIRHMALMNFPRYIQRESRDFFYLTLRHVLPGPPIAASSAEPDEGQWRVQGLPQYGWPFAIAMTMLRPDPQQPDVRLSILKIDPKTVQVSIKDDSRERTIVEFRSSLEVVRGGAALWLYRFGFQISQEPPGPDAIRVGWGYTPGDPRAEGAIAALGVTEDGMGVYVEVSAGSGRREAAAALSRTLKQIGCEALVRIDRPLDLAIGGDRDLAGHPVARNQRGAVRLVRRQAPGAERIFEQTPIVLPSVWAPLQAGRARQVKLEGAPAH
ncbi:MAG TPA: hypothetical protein VGJ84_05760, partial [Polyangiaceae bacterium]